MSARLHRWLPLLVLLVLPGLLTPVAGADEPARSFTLAAAGDILIHGMVADQALQYGGGAAYDFLPMLGPTEPWISEADLAICHLEGTLSATNTGLSFYPFFVGPHEVADAIAAVGYDACSTSSNHAMDGGPDGLAQTLELLDERGIAHAGTARSEEERLPSLYEVNGITVAHMDYAYDTNGVPQPYWYSVNRIDQGLILSDARWAREHGADFVIVSLHWGREDEHPPTAEQEALAEALMASPDVDLILGSHAHVVQPIDWVNGKLVVYGMGNHLSNQNQIWGPSYWSTEDGLMVYLTITEQADGTFATTVVQYIPTWVEFRTYRVLPIAWALAAGEGDPNLMQASWDRTVGFVNLLGAPGLDAATADWAPVSCSGQVATIVGTPGPDTLIGTPGDDVVTGRGGNDVVLAMGGNDLVCGGDGNDALWGGPGDDALWGGAGDDRLYGEPGHDRLYGGAGDDTLWGGPDGDTLHGEEGDDALLGHEGADLLIAGPGVNWLWGGLGADDLIGHGPDDTLQGDLADACRIAGRIVDCGG
jgi:hypothetical protein